MIALLLLYLHCSPLRLRLRFCCCCRFCLRLLAAAQPQPGSHEVGNACIACVPAADTSTAGRPAALGGAASRAAPMSEGSRIAPAICELERHRPERAPARVPNAWGRSPRRRSRSEAATPTEEQSDERILRQQVRKWGWPPRKRRRRGKFAQQTRSRLRRRGIGRSGHATAWRLQGRQPGPRAFQRGLQAEPRVPIRWNEAASTTRSSAMFDTRGDNAQRQLDGPQQVAQKSRCSCRCLALLRAARQRQISEGGHRSRWTRSLGLALREATCAGARGAKNRVGRCLDYLAGVNKRCCRKASGRSRITTPATRRRREAECLERRFRRTRPGPDRTGRIRRVPCIPRTADDHSC